MTVLKNMDWWQEIIFADKISSPCHISLTNLSPKILFLHEKSSNDFRYHYCKYKCSWRELNPQLALRRRLLYPFNYKNKCRIFGLFQPSGLRLPSLWILSLAWWIFPFLILTFRLTFFNSNDSFPPFLFRNLQLNTSLHPDVSLETSAYSWLTY